MMHQQRRVARWLRQRTFWMSLAILCVCLVAAHYAGGVRAQQTDFASFQELLRLGRGSAETVAWRPDGTQVAVGGSLGVWVYTASFQDVAHWANDAEVLGLAWSPDGSRLAGVERNPTLLTDSIRIWDTVTGISIFTSPDLRIEAFGIAWSPDGAKIAVPAGDGALVWDVATGQELGGFEGHGLPTNSVAWNPSSTRLATAGDGNTVKIWDLATGQLVATLQGHTSGVYRVTWNPNGTWLATSSYDGTVRIWDIATGQTLSTLEGDRYVVAWSPDGTRLASGLGTTINVWSVAAGGPSGITTTLLSTLEPHLDVVMALAWRPDGNGVASIDGSGVVRIWDVNTSQPLQVLQRHQGNLVWTVAWRPGANQVANASYDKVYVWDAASGQLLNTFAHSRGVTSLAWRADGTQLAGGALDGTVRIWDVVTAQQVTRFQASSVAIQTIAWSGDGSKIATGGDGTSIGVWNAAAGQAVTMLTGHSDMVTSVAWSPDGLRLASSSYDQTARVWTVSTGASTILSGHTGPVNAVAWNPSGTRVATVGADGTVRLWDAADEESVASWSQDESSLLLGWHPTGNYLAVDQGTDIRILDAATGNRVATLTLPTRAIQAFSWSSDGSKLAIANDEGAISIWGVPPGTPTPTPTPTNTVGAKGRFAADSSLKQFTNSRGAAAESWICQVPEISRGIHRQF